MKTNNLKWIAIVLSTLLLFQSCKVYHKNTSTVDEVVASQKQVKVKTNYNQTYEFDRLEREGDKIYGYAKNKSSTTEKLSNYGVEGTLDGNYQKILLSEETVKEYHLKNGVLSTVITISIPLLVVSGALFLIGLKTTGSLK